jgi:hypothetical protein
MHDTSSHELMMLWQMSTGIVIQKSCDTGECSIFDGGRMRQDTFGFVYDEIIQMLEHNRYRNIWRLTQDGWIQISLFWNQRDGIVRSNEDRSLATISAIDQDKSFFDQIVSESDTKRLICADHDIESITERRGEDGVHRKTGKTKSDSGVRKAW